MAEKKEAIYSSQVKAGKRTYFFDVKESSNGSRYLTITESKKVEDKFERSSVMIFSEDIPNIFAALREAGKVVKG